MSTERWHAVGRWVVEDCAEQPEEPMPLFQCDLPANAVTVANIYNEVCTAALAASPTPTGPEPATAECEYYGHFTAAGQRYHHNIAYGGARIEKCGPATPEPTEETP